MTPRAFLWKTLFLLVSVTGTAEETPQEAPPFPFEELHEKEAPENSRFLTEFIRMLFILGLMVTVLVLATWFFKRMGSVRIQQQNVSSDLKILEKRSLSPKAALYLVEFNDNQFLLGESPMGLVRLGQISTNENPKSP